MNRVDQSDTDTVPASARRFVAVLLTLLAVPALIGFDAWPLTAWRLFSLSRDATQTRWTLDANNGLGPIGGDFEVSLEDLPLQFRNAEWILAELPGSSESQRHAVCLALLEGVRGERPDTTQVVIVRERQRLDEVDGEWVVSEEREPFEACTTAGPRP